MDTRKKIIAIVGETCSGKDTFAKHLSELDPDKFRAVVSYTNRPKRDNETEGVEHYFLSKAEFAAKKNVERKNIVAYTKIASEKNKDGYEYMATFDELNKSGIYIIDPNGLDYLKGHFGDKIDVVSIYIYCPFIQRKERAKMRSDYSTEFTKRCWNEKAQFDHFYRHKKFDYIIYNFNGLLEESFKTIESIVDYEIYDRYLESEYTSVLGAEYSKKDILNAVSFLSTISEFYKNQYIKDSSLIRYSDKNTNLIRNILLSHLR